VTPSARKRIWLALLAGAIAAFLVPSAARGAGFDPGLIEIQGLSVETSTRFDLTEVGSPNMSIPGRSEKGYPLRKILLLAQERTDGAIDMAAFLEPVEVSRPGNRNLRVDQKRVTRSTYDASLPIYFIGSDGNVNMWDPAASKLWTYTSINPAILVPRQEHQLKVDISPAGPVNVKAGQKKTFTVSVENSDGASVSLDWMVNGVRRQSGSSGTDGRFTYEFRDEGKVVVAVFADATNGRRGNDAVTVYVGKAPAKKKPDRKKKKSDDAGVTPTDDGGYYTPGYTDYGDYGSGTGTGTGSGTPSPGGSSPAKPQKQPEKQEEPAADDGLETVTGQLVDPSRITVVPSSSDDPAGSSEQAEAVEEDEGGGGIPEGAMTALGIGVLLGLGGLAEVGAFSGFGRFRFRP